MRAHAARPTSGSPKRTIVAFAINPKFVGVAVLPAAAPPVLHSLQWSRSSPSPTRVLAICIRMELCLQKYLPGLALAMLADDPIEAEIIEELRLRVARYGLELVVVRRADVCRTLGLPSTESLSICRAMAAREEVAARHLGPLPLGQRPERARYWEMSAVALALARAAEDEIERVSLPSVPESDGAASVSPSL